MVSSGTVSVEARYQGDWIPLSLEFTVLPRPNFVFAPVAPIRVENGVDPEPELTVPDPPTRPSPGTVTHLGLAYLTQDWRISALQIEKGPNAGLWYATSIENRTRFRWVITPQLYQRLEFFQRQCGNYSVRVPGRGGSSVGRPV